MTDSDRAHEDELLAFLSALTFDDLPPDVVEAAESLVLDHVLCADIGMDQPWVRILREQVAAETQGWAPGPSGVSASVYGSAGRVPARMAAMVNGTASHGLELDDTYWPALLHPGSVVVPAAVAAAPDGDGRRLLTAVVAGYEFLCRLLPALGTAHSFQGFHGTGVFGPMAAAVAVCTALEADPRSLRDAVRVAASFGGGIKAFQGGPGMVKRLHAGRAAEAGLLAAHLAGRGFQGPVDALTGRFGILEVYACGGATDARALSAALGERFVVQDVYIKPFAACGAVHGAVYAALALREQERVRVEDVERVEIGATVRTVDQNRIERPTDPMTAQYSVEYSTALALSGLVHDLRRYQEPELYADPAVRALIDRTTVVVDDEAEAHFPQRRDARVTVVLRDGQRRSRYAVVDGATSAGLGVVEDKARRLWDGRLPPARQEALLSSMHELARGGRIADVLGHLVDRSVESPSDPNANALEPTA